MSYQRAPHDPYPPPGYSSPYPPPGYSPSAPPPPPHEGYPPPPPPPPGYPGYPPPGPPPPGYPGYPPPGPPRGYQGYFAEGYPTPPGPPQIIMVVAPRSYVDAFSARNSELNKLSDKSTTDCYFSHSQYLQVLGPQDKQELFDTL
eukprot:XP_024445088.1 basic proline-rich protein [Populus trichocarpa]